MNPRQIFCMYRHVQQSSFDSQDVTTGKMEHRHKWSRRQTYIRVTLKGTTNSDVVKAFPGGRAAHSEDQTEEENEENLRKNLKTTTEIEGRLKKYSYLAHLGLEVTALTTKLLRS